MRRLRSNRQWGAYESKRPTAPFRVYASACSKGGWTARMRCPAGASRQWGAYESTSIVHRQTHFLMRLPTRVPIKFLQAHSIHFPCVSWMKKVSQQKPKPWMIERGAQRNSRCFPPVNASSFQEFRPGFA